jgi:hypothetical protein
MTRGLTPLRRYLLSGVSHLAATRAEAAQAWIARRNTAATPTPTGRNRPKAHNGASILRADRGVEQ